jgi:ADP-dependent NAD(P)H-hydrate dehydratase / NAD(P)H-hydrate epimerase
MLRVLPPTQSLPLHGRAATRRIESQAQAALPPHALMRRAGLEVARCALAIAPHARAVWIAAGPGNNGGDGLEAAIHLQTAGKQVHVHHLAAGQGGPPEDARDALERALAAGLIFAKEPPPLGAGDLAIDALLGVGASRGPEGEMAHRIRQLNALPCAVLAVDLPSGLCPDSGRLLGEQAVRARHTLALLTLKPGLFTAEGRDHAGDVWLSSLDVQTGEAPDAWLVGLDNLHAPAFRHSAHKGRHGDTLIVGGAPGMAGAAWLAARAAHAAGSGRVFFSLLDPQAPAWDAARPELMARPAGWPESNSVLGQCTVVAGCGGGQAVAAALPRLLSVAKRLVLDADGLNAVANDSALGLLLRARASRRLATVLTPHPLEAARLLGCSAAQVQADRPGAARQLAAQTSAIVVLKGSGTVIATPDGGPPWINATGNAALATAGTGDVLAGWIGGHWSVLHGEPDPDEDDPAAASRDDALAAALAGVCLHGVAADQAGVSPLRAADLIECMLLARARQRG